MCATSTATSQPRAFLENFIDEAEKRVWFLYESGRSATATGR